MVSARLADIVLLPSPARDEVTTSVRGWLAASTNWRFVRSDRKASARGDRGSTRTMSGRFVASGSWAMEPRIGASVTALTSSSVFTVLSSVSRTRAAARPRRRPRTAPRRMLRSGLGATGSVGVVGGRTTVTLTGLASVPAGLSSSVTAAGNSLAMASPIAWAWAGSVSRTATSMSTVSGGVVAVTWSAMSPVTPDRGRDRRKDARRREQLRVGLHPLLGERAALEQGAAVVGPGRRDEELGARLVDLRCAAGWRRSASMTARSTAVTMTRHRFRTTGR